jgi:predicted lipoprotein with Yx(FWY)xxD motif
MTLDISRTLRLPALLAFMAMMVIVAACSSSGGAATTAPSAAPSAAAPSESASASAAPSEAAPSSAAPAAAAVELKLATGTLGKFLTDGAGKTLYMFTPDEDQAAPTCNDQCAASWPALTASAASDVTVGDGLDASKIKLVKRADGTQQVIYGEYPLYYFAKDSAAGDTNGQGVLGKWYVVNGEGEPIKS